MEYGPLVSCLSSPSWIWFTRQTLTLQGLGCSVPPLSAELRIFDMESQFDPVLSVAQSPWWTSGSVEIPEACV